MPSRILVIDDNQELLDTYQQILEPEGFDVQVSLSPFENLADIERLKFDLIILSNLIGSLSDVQNVLEQLHKVCHDNTKIIVTYYNYLWEPVIKFAEFLGIKKKTPKQKEIGKKQAQSVKVWE